MTDKPDFSRDTGAGKPGIDNIHIPGRSYRSHAVEDTGCAICRQRVGYWEHDGVTLYGTEGQLVEYIWIARGEDVPQKCTICDVCLAEIVASGRVEMIFDADGKHAKNMSIVAILELFALGARDALARYYEIRDADVLCSDFFVPASVTEIAAAMKFAAVIGSMCDAINAGRHYAAAALAFGLAARDPGFEAAAAVYVSTYPHCGMTEAEIENLEDKERLVRMFAEMTLNGD